MELELEMRPKGASDFGLKVRCAPDSSEETVVSLSSQSQTIAIDYRKTSLRDDLNYQPEHSVQIAPLNFKQGDVVKLRVFLDHSVMEVFADDRRYLSQRIFPVHPNAQNVKLYSCGAPTLFRSLRAWQMGSMETNSL